MVAAVANAMMSAQADQACGAGYGERSGERVNQRNGYRTASGTPARGRSSWRSQSCARTLITRDWLLTHRRRAEQALVTVVATAYLLGISTRRVERLAEQLGIKPLSRSQVSEIAAHLDAQVSAFLQRPLDAGSYTFVWADALSVKVREDGRVVNVHALIATGVNADGHREILGVDVVSAEDGAGWLAFWRGLVARGLSGVQLVISDAHPWLVTAIGSALPTTCAICSPRCPSPPSCTWPPRSRTIFDPADAAAVVTQFDRVVAALSDNYPDAAEHLEATSDELLGFTAYPREVWRQIWSNNPRSG